MTERFLELSVMRRWARMALSPPRPSGGGLPTSGHHHHHGRRWLTVMGTRLTDLSAQRRRPRRPLQYISGAGVRCFADGAQQTRRLCGYVCTRAASALSLSLCRSIRPSWPVAPLALTNSGFLRPTRNRLDSPSSAVTAAGSRRLAAVGRRLVLAPPELGLAALATFLTTDMRDKRGTCARGI